MRTVVYLVYLVSVRMRTHSSIFNNIIYEYTDMVVYTVNRVYYHVSSYLILQAQYPRWP